jgi:hypothetical protein
MGSTDSQPKVDNPYLSALKTLKSNLITETQDLTKLFETTSKDMGGKKVWVGKTADTWTTDVDGRRGRMKTLVDKLIPAVDAEIAKCPPKVTQGEAKMMRMDLEGY